MILATLLLWGGGGTHAQDDAGGAGVSRAMRVAIRFYEQGEDMQAMDRFMEILTKGDPSERSMANEYINLITHRMNHSGGASGAPAGRPTDGLPPPPAGQGKPAYVPPTTAPSENRGAKPRDETPPAPKEPPSSLSSDRPEAPAKAANPAPATEPGEKPEKPARRRAARDEDMSASNKAVMRKEIRARLRNAQEKSLSDLKAFEGIRVVMRENGDPEAIGIPSALLYQSGIAFQREATKVLDPLTKLIFALGSTQAVILPEGTAVGDAKVLDMRRTMGISSHLFSAGVAPPRVRVNLLNTQVDIPRGLLDFRGVVIVFIYGQPLNLVAESAVGDELGPPVSLGVFPSTIRPGRNQGAVIEFSVSDPPAGLVSWKFQLFQPSADGADMTPLQEVVGGGPVFHQIFWNGRQNYFGDPLPAGRYECVLSALDAKNRRRKEHRWILVMADAGGEKLLAVKNDPPAAADTPAEAPVAAAAVGKAPSAELGGDSAAPLVKGVKAAAPAPETEGPAPAAKAAAPAGRQIAKAKTSARRVVKRAMQPKKAAKADKARAARAAEPKAEVASAPAPAPDAQAKAVAADAAAGGKFALLFNRNTHQMTSAAEKSLARAVANTTAYPLESLKVTGHAASDEADGSSLADRRAKMVAGLLINRYQIDPRKIQVASSASGNGAKVELDFVRSK